MAINDGMSKSAAARTFSVSRSTIKVWAARWRDTGGFVPRPRSGRRPHIRVEQYDDLRAQLESAPDALLIEHCQSWKESHGVRLSVAAMHRTIKRLGWTRKKR
jgi:transposase